MAEVAQGYKGPSPKSFDLDENFKPQHTLFCCDIEIFHNLRTFSNTLGKKSPYPNNCIPTFSFLLPSSCQSSQSSCLVFKTIQEKEKNTFENFGKISVCFALIWGFARVTTDYESLAASHVLRQPGFSSVSAHSAS